MTKPTVEGLKEVGRWLVLLLISWVIAQTVGQIEAVPNDYQLKIWVFTYSIPVRTTLMMGLTLLGRYIDKVMHESDTKALGTKHTGLLPF